MRLSDIPIRVKLSAMLILACAGVLVAACAAFVAFDRVSTMEAKRGTLGVLTDTVGQTLTGPVAFRDTGSTETVLQKLEAEPTAMAAAVYVDEGTRMAGWTREGVDALGESQAALDPEAFGGDILLVRPIMGPEGPVATLAVRYSTADVIARTWRFLSIAGLVLLASVLLAALAAGRLQRLISNPVAALADAASRVQEEGDYSVRAEVRGKDELGRLASTFNEMLSGIQQRDAELIEYQHGLEQKVADRTRDLDARNTAMRLVLDNVDQGFVTLDAQGGLSPERSAAFDAWFGVPADGVSLAEHLAGPGSAFEAWCDLAWEALDDGFMPVEITMSQFPASLSRDGREYTLDWQPLMADEETLDGILVVVTDVTEAVAREQADREQRELLAAFRAVRSDRSGFEGFFTEATRIVDAVQRADALAEPALLQREVHTLKGNAALFGVETVVGPCHTLEDRLASGEDVQQDEVDAVVQAWEGFAARTELFRGEDDAVHVSGDEWRSLVARARSSAEPTLVEALERLTWDDVQGRLRGLAARGEQLADKLGKCVQVEVDAAGVRVPPGVYDTVFSSLAHVVRNALDHGIEAPEARVAAGKPEQGWLRLEAQEGALEELRDQDATTLGAPRHASDWVAVGIIDDGAGIDWEGIRARAVSEGLDAETPEDLVRALFHDGLSTASSVTETSGRGAGTSALLAVVEARGGLLEVSTSRGRGTTFRLLLPVEAGVTERLAA